jgi:hypothetical protein
LHDFTPVLIEVFFVLSLFISIKKQKALAKSKDDRHRVPRGTTSIRLSVARQAFKAPKRAA